MLNSNSIRKDFPLLANNPGFVYLDSGATALKPKIVIDKVTEYYKEYSANIHRGIYRISERATKEYEATRLGVANFIGAKPEEIVFTRNTTEGINLVMYSLGRSLIQKGDEIATTVMEHHSNFVPWQQLAFASGADFKVIDIDDDGILSMYENGELRLGGLISKKTKILAITYISNVLGTVNDIAGIIKKAKEINPSIITIVDAAQAVPYIPVNVNELGCDFLVFSSHKCLGPTGVGILWGKYDLLDQMEPFLYGGDMIQTVHIEKTEFKKPPEKFEAGTPDIANIIGLKSALEYISSLGLENIRAHEKELANYALLAFKKEFGDTVRIFGPKERSGIVAFDVKGCHPHDIAQILDEENIAVRAGHHCAMPLHTRLGVNATTRASFNVYNSREDIDKLIIAVKRSIKLLRR